MRSAQQYRRDIFVLKQKLKEQSLQLQSLQQKYSSLDPFSKKNYSFSLKQKLIEMTLEDIRLKLAHFALHPAFIYYKLNYSVFALARCCEIMSISPQMVFRGVSNEMKVQWQDLKHFLTETLRMDAEMVQPLADILADKNQMVHFGEYEKMLQCFLIAQEQEGETKLLNQGVERVAEAVVKQRIQVEKIFNEKEIDIAKTVYSLKGKIKDIGVLDCVACYCKCDPVKSGNIHSGAVVALLKKSIWDINNVNRQIKLSKK